MPNKKISELNDNTNPSGSDIFPVVHNGETLHQTFSGLTTFITSGITGGTAAPERVYFYTIEYNGKKNIPANNPLSAQKADSNAPFLFEAFGKSHPYFSSTTVDNFYSNFLFEVIEENGIHVDGLQFNALSGLSSYLTTNLASSGGTLTNHFTVKMYGVKKTDYQPLTKVRGINTFFSILKGRGSYWRRAVKTSGTHHFPTDLYSAGLSDVYTEPQILNEFMFSVYNHFLGTSQGTFNSYNIDDVKSTFWFENDPKRYNNLYAIKQITNPTSDVTYPRQSGLRKAIDGSGTFLKKTPITMSATSIYMLDKGADRIYHTNGNQYTDPILRGDNNSANLRLKQPIISKTGVDNSKIINLISSIRVYHLVSADGFSCFLIKPMGIDTLLVDYIEDNTNASLYGLFTSPSNRRPVVVKFNNTTKTDNKIANVGWRIMLDDYESFTLDTVTPLGNFNPLKFMNKIGRYGKNTFRNFRLFYGYPDGTISPLSDDELTHVINSNGCPVKRLVIKKPIN